MSQENVEIVRRAFDAYNRRDARGFAELCALEVEIVPLRAAVEETTYRGPDAATRFFTESDEAWVGLSLEAEEAHDLGEKVLALGTLRGRGRVSGVEVEMEFGWLFEFDDGLITSARTYGSREDALAATGLSE